MTFILLDVLLVVLDAGLSQTKSRRQTFGKHIALEQALYKAFLEDIKELKFQGL